MLRVLSSASFVNQRGCAYVQHIAETAGSAWTLPARALTRASPHLGINAIEAAALFIVHAKKRLPELLAGNAAAGPASSSIDLVSGGAAENCCSGQCFRHH